MPTTVYGEITSASPLLTRAVQVTMTGGGTTIATGVQGYIIIPIACTITGWTLIAGPTQSGAIVVDVWRCTYSQFDAGSTHPVSGDSLVGAGTKPTITATNSKGQFANLTSWTTSLAAGDILAFNVVSVTSLTVATLEMSLSVTP